MVFSGFPGLMQLGVFSAVGLATCAVLTWTLLPRLIVAANLAPVAAGDPAWLPVIERWRRWRWLGLLPVAAALLYLGAIGGPRWEGDLDQLSPVPEASRALDQELRGELGAPEPGRSCWCADPTREAVLQAQEALLPALERLRGEGALHRVRPAPRRLLPSVAAAAGAAGRAARRRDLLAARVEARRAPGCRSGPRRSRPFLRRGRGQPRDGAAHARPTSPARCSAPGSTRCWPRAARAGRAR